MSELAEIEYVISYRTYGNLSGRVGQILLNISPPSVERLFVRVRVGTLGVEMLRLKHLFGIWQLASNSKHKFVAKDFLISKSLFLFSIDSTLFF